MSAGWLAADFSTQNELAPGITVDRAKFPTRYEEYRFVRDTLAKVPTGTVLDAGSGFNPEIHLLPYVLEANGWQVAAVDSNYESLKMPTTMHVTRYVDDIRSLWRWHGSDLDAYVCVSTLEHMEPLLQSWVQAIEVAFACLRSGGIAVFTADMIAPSRLNSLLRWGGFDTGAVEPTPAKTLTPPVSWAIGRKP
jgi:SAM-dependent methyltransferase